MNDAAPAQRNLARLLVGLPVLCWAAALLAYAPGFYPASATTLIAVSLTAALLNVVVGTIAIVRQRATLVAIVSLAAISPIELFSLVGMVIVILYGGI